MDYNLFERFLIYTRPHVLHHIYTVDTLHLCKKRNTACGHTPSVSAVVSCSSSTVLPSSPHAEMKTKITFTP